jgi:hypothetical protein
MSLEISTYAQNYAHYPQLVMNLFTGEQIGII